MITLFLALPLKKVGKNTNTTQTNENGEFTFAAFPVGQHTITLEADGIKKQSKSIEVLANKTTFVAFKMEEEANTLSEILIRVNDLEVPLSAYTLIDFSVGYKWRHFSILAKVSNITDELNYDVHENYIVNPLAPRQYTATLKYKF